MLATDVVTRFLKSIDALNLEVRRHDLVADPLPDDRFDLIHTQLLLTHLPGRAALVQRLASALVPGGWLVLEEFDITPTYPDPRLGPERRALAERVLNAFHASMDARRGGEGA